MIDSVLDEKFTLEDLLDTSILQEVMAAFGQCFGLGIGLVSESGQEILSYCPEHAFCERIKDSPLKDKCEEVKKKIVRHPLEGSQVLQIKSFCGVKYSLLPLTYQLENLGRVIIGPFRDPDLPLETIQGAASADPKNPVDLKEIEKLPAIYPARLKEEIKLLAKILDAFLFINAKRLITTRLHLEAIFSEREKIFRQVELQDSGTDKDKEEIDRLKNMF